MTMSQYLCVLSAALGSTYCSGVSPGAASSAQYAAEDLFSVGFNSVSEGDRSNVMTALGHFTLQDLRDFTSAFAPDNATTVDGVPLAKLAASLSQKAQQPAASSQTLSALWQANHVVPTNLSTGEFSQGVNALLQSATKGHSLATTANSALVLQANLLTDLVFSIVKSASRTLPAGSALGLAGASMCPQQPTTPQQAASTGAQRAQYAVQMARLKKSVGEKSGNGRAKLDDRSADLNQPGRSTQMTISTDDYSRPSANAAINYQPDDATQYDDMFWTKVTYPITNEQGTTGSARYRAGVSDRDSEASPDVYLDCRVMILPGQDNSLASSEAMGAIGGVTELLNGQW